MIGCFSHSRNEQRSLPATWVCIRYVRLQLPPVTEDGRKETVKKAKAIAEEAKIALRNVRRDCMDKIKKAEKQKEIGENESRRQTELVQKLLDKHIKLVDEMVAAKEKQIMTI